jgi:hypothetical protein
VTVVNGVEMKNAAFSENSVAELLVGQKFMLALDAVYLAK